jgi:hypothetical protein
MIELRGVGGLCRKVPPFPLMYSIAAHKPSSEAGPWRRNSVPTLTARRLPRTRSEMRRMVGR